MPISLHIVAYLRRANANSETIAVPSDSAIIQEATDKTAMCTDEFSVLLAAKGSNTML
jgi:hypothetical protein